MLPFGAAAVQVTVIWLGAGVAEVMPGFPGGVVVAATPVPIEFTAERLKAYVEVERSPSAGPSVVLVAEASNFFGLPLVTGVQLKM